MDDLLYRSKQIELIAFLEKNKLFYDWETAMGNLILLIQDKKLKFSNDKGGRFSEEVLFKIIDESTGFMGCLKQGSYYSALHHSRGLIELYSITQYTLSNEGINKNVLELFDKFNKLRRHIIYLDMNDGKNPMNFSKENHQFLEENYSTIDPEILTVFGYDTVEKAREAIKKSSSWLPIKIIKFNDVIEKAGAIHTANYETFCYYAHFSPLPNRRNNITFGLRDDWEKTLTVTADYSFKCYALIRDTNYIDDSSKQLLDDVFSILAVSLAPRVVEELKNLKP